MVFLIGWTAIREGRFIRKETPKQSMTDLSIVPSAAPLIAGPGVIAASIAASAEGGLGSTVPALCIAIPVNYLLMFFCGADKSAFAGSLSSVSRGWLLPQSRCR